MKMRGGKALLAFIHWRNLDEFGTHYLGGLLFGVMLVFTF
jgi:hypothetical protein